MSFLRFQQFQQNNSNKTIALSNKKTLSLSLINSTYKMVRPTLKNSQTHSNNSSAICNELFECVSPHCGVGAQRVKKNNTSNQFRKTTHMDMFIRKIKTNVSFWSILILTSPCQMTNRYPWKTSTILSVAGHVSSHPIKNIISD